MVGAWAGRVVEPRERQLDQVASGYGIPGGKSTWSLRWLATRAPQSPMGAALWLVRSLRVRRAPGERPSRPCYVNPAIAGVGAPSPEVLN